MEDRLSSWGSRGFSVPARSPSTRVGERGAVAAHAVVVELQRAVVHAQLVRHELLAVAVVAGDDAGHGLRAGVAVADADAHSVADAQPLAAARVVDVDRHRAHGHQLALLPRPGEVAGGVAARAAGEDRL